MEKRSNVLGARIAAIREKMDFFSEYYAEEATSGRAVTLRIYSTKRSGTYGHQFAAIVWLSGFSDSYQDAASSRSAGCGYDKENHVATEALRLAGFVDADFPPINGALDGGWDPLTLLKNLRGEWKTHYTYN